MIIMNGGARTLAFDKRGFDGMLRKRKSTIFRERTGDQSCQRDNIRDQWSHLFISLSLL
jgi:hypothetical protein